jgi:hypothetical protein
LSPRQPGSPERRRGKEKDDIGFGGLHERLDAAFPSKFPIVARSRWR